MLHLAGWVNVGVLLATFSVGWIIGLRYPDVGEGVRLGQGVSWSTK